MIYFLILQNIIGEKKENQNGNFSELIKYNLSFCVLNAVMSFFTMLITYDLVG